MRLRDLLVVLDGSARMQAQLDLAVDLAQRHDAHLTGFCTLGLLLPEPPGIGLGIYPETLALRGATDQLQAKIREDMDGIEAAFRERLRRNGIEGDWQIASGTLADAVARRARTVDVTVLGQTDPDHPPPEAGRHLIEDVLMLSGRPVLLVPYVGRYTSVGGNVLLGWNGTREAARAAHDALPLIGKAAKVTVLTVERTRGTDGVQDVPGAEMAAHLARYGLTVSAARTFADGSISDADALLAYAADSSADLLVVGGYGHSRTREMILGGVTRELLDHMTLPVLMTH